MDLIRNTSWFAVRQCRNEIAGDLRPVYMPAPSEAAAKERFAEFSANWGRQYRPSPGLDGKYACGGIVPFLDCNIEIPRVICSTNARRVEKAVIPDAGLMVAT